MLIQKRTKPAANLFNRKQGSGTKAYTMPFMIWIFIFYRIGNIHINYIDCLWIAYWLPADATESPTILLTCTLQLGKLAKAHARRGSKLMHKKYIRTRSRHPMRQNSQVSCRLCMYACMYVCVSTRGTRYVFIHMNKNIWIYISLCLSLYI